MSFYEIRHQLHIHEKRKQTNEYYNMNFTEDIKINVLNILYFY